MLPCRFIIVENDQGFRLLARKGPLRQVGGAYDDTIAVTGAGQQVQLGVSDGLSKHSKAGLPSVDSFQDAQVALVIQTHDGGSGITYHDLLKCQNRFYFTQGGLAAENALEGVEGILIQHPDNCVDTGRVSQHAECVIAFKQVPVKLLLVDKSRPNYSQPGSVVQGKLGLILKSFKQLQSLRFSRPSDLEKSRSAENDKYLCAR